MMDKLVHALRALAHAAIRSCGTDVRDVALTGAIHLATVALEREATLRCGLKRIRAIASDSTFPDDGAYDRIAEEATSLLDALPAPPETGAPDAR